MTSPPSTDHLSSWHVPIPSDLQGSLSPEAYALKDVTINGVTSVSMLTAIVLVIMKERAWAKLVPSSPQQVHNLLS